MALRPAVARARVAKDIQMLQASTTMEVEVDPEEVKYPTIYVTIPGPVGSLYEGARYKLCCVLTSEYPIKSPSIAFKTRIWHPNVEPRSGAICLDVLRDRWTPVISLHDVFDLYIPQLLQYPEPSDPFNAQAAAMMKEDETEYASYVREYVRTHGIPSER